MKNEAASEVSANPSRSAQSAGEGLMSECLNLMIQQHHERMHGICDDEIVASKTAESPDELVKQPEFKKIENPTKNDNPVYRGCGTGGLPEIELFDSSSFSS